MANTINVVDASNSTITVATNDAILARMPLLGANVALNSTPVNIVTDQTAILTSSAIVDGISPSTKATVAAFHNADNQTIGATGYGLLTGGVAQLLNASGNLDRQKETGVDGVPSLGIASGAQQFAVPINTTLTSAVTLNAAVQSVAVGSSTNYQVGGTVSVSAGTVRYEIVTITAIVDATHFSAIFTKNHNSGDACQTFVYNQARDASVGDNQPLTGMSLSMTSLYNAITNLGELDRSAAGELDGASGKGTAVAAEYEFNGGGPVLVSGLTTGLMFDRARNLQGKGLGSGAITTSVSGNANIIFGSSTATNTLLPGMGVRLRGGASMETVYVSTTWVPGSSATVPLQSPVVIAGQTTAEWGVFITNGPGLSGFIADGIGIEEEAIWDPVTSLFYIERASTQDAMPATNIVAESGVVWNGSTFDRMRSASLGNNIAATGIAAEAAYGQYNATLPTITTGNYTSLQTDINGRLISAVTGTYATGSVVISISTTTSAVISQLTGGRLAGLQIPAAFTGTSISFQVSADNTTFSPFKASGSLVTIAVAASDAVDIFGPFRGLTSWPYIKIVSNATEAAARTITYVTR